MSFNRRVQIWGRCPDSSKAFTTDCRKYRIESVNIWRRAGIRLPVFHRLTRALRIFIPNSVWIFQLRLQSLCDLDSCHSVQPSRTAPVSQAPCTAGIASVKGSLTSDDSNRRNDPGQITNVWAVPKDLSWNDFVLGALQPWQTPRGHELSLHTGSIGHCPTAFPSYPSGQPSANLAFLGLKWKGSGSSFSLQTLGATGAFFEM